MINGKFYDELQLNKLVSGKLQDTALPQWEKNVYQFISEWISDEDTIEVRTSGTTGAPRKYKVTKNAMLISARKTISFFNLKPGNKALLCLSPHYIAGKLMIVRSFAGKLDLLPVKPSSMPLEGITYDIHFAAMVPMQVQNQIDKNANSFNKLKTLIIGGGEVSPALKEKLQHITTEVWETYGMTETLTHVALKKINGKDKSDWFSPLEGVKISKTGDSRLVVFVKGITENKLVTNDITEFKDEDHFSIPGRADDAINTGGIKVMPQNIEKKLEGAINASFVISSVPDKVLGEKIVLVIEGKGLPTQNISTSFFNDLEFFERPKEIIVLETIPRTETGKIKRKELRSLLSEK